MDVVICLTNILLIIVSIGVMHATYQSIRVSKSMQKEIQRQRFARYKTIVLYYVRVCYERDTFDTDKAAFQRFLLLVDTRQDKKYMQHIIKEYNIEDSEEFLRYVCNVCDASDYTFDLYRRLIR